MRKSELKNFLSFLLAIALIFSMGAGSAAPVLADDLSAGAAEEVQTAQTKQETEAVNQTAQALQETGTAETGEPESEAAPIKITAAAELEDGTVLSTDEKIADKFKDGSNIFADIAPALDGYTYDRTVINGRTEETISKSDAVYSLPDQGTLTEDTKIHFIYEKEESETQTPSAEPETEAAAARRVLGAAQAGGSDKTASFHTAITSQKDVWSSGVTAIYSVSYSIDQGSMNEGDYVIVSIPQDVISEVDWAVSPQHFSSTEDLGDGRYKLVFGPNANTALTGSFTMNLTMKNDSDTSKTGTIQIGETSKEVTVNPVSHSSGTSGRDTRAIVKDAATNNDVGFGDYDYSDGQGNNAKQIGIIKSNTDGVFTFRLFINSKEADMTGVTVTDTLPGGMHFTGSNTKVYYHGENKSSETVDAGLYQLSLSGNTLTFSYPGELKNRCIAVCYEVQVDDTKNAKYTNTADIVYTEDGNQFAEHTGYVLQGSGYNAANGEKQVNKTEITNDSSDQEVCYSFKFWDNNAIAAGKIDFTDTLDSHVKFESGVSSEYFSITQDENNPQVIHIKNVKDLPANTTLYARFFVDMSGVPAGYTVANTAGGNTVYTTKKALVRLNAVKLVNGETPGADHIYKFQLLDSDGKVLQTKENDAEGNIAFSPLEYGDDAAGKTFTYKIKEVSGSGARRAKSTAPKMQYDNTVYNVTVNVSEGADSQSKDLSVTTTVSKEAGSGTRAARAAAKMPANAMVFNNTYTPEPVSANITAKKFLTGRDLKDGEFSFTISAAEGTPMPANTTVTNKADGTVDFGDITFDKAGTYTYTIREEKGSLSGVTYDESEKTVTVKVSDNGEGKLIAEVSGAGDEAALKNEYAPSSAAADITAKKSLTGRDLKDGEFSFTISAAEGTPMPANTTVTNKADGTVDFGEVTYTKAGTYTYTIREEKGNLGGVTYDESEKTVTVKVSDDGKGQLIAEVSGAGDEAAFKNEYAPSSITADITAKKSLTGRDLKDGEFSFTISAAEDTPMPANTTVTNKADGTVDFGKITYTKAGTYTYTIKEEKGNLGGVNYDNSEKTVTVTVKDNLDGKLTATVSGDGDAAEFENTYKAEETTANITAKKSLTGRDLKDGEFSFTISAAEGTPMPANTTVTNKADGTVDFGKITYTKAGTYTYTIKEDNGNLGGVTYDDSEKTVTVTVKDNLDGKLTATVSGDGDAAEFKNTYKAEETTANITAKKSLTGRDLKDGEFSFTISAAEGTPMPAQTTVTNKADGTVDFGEITYTKAGTYTYTIREDKGNLGGVTYDDSEKSVTVKVSDNGEGKLIAEVTGDGEDAAFANHYDAAGSAAISGTKTVNGGSKTDKLDGFTFTLTETDASGKALEGAKTLKAITDKEGKFSFEEIPYTLNDAGTHYYLLDETDIPEGYSRNFKAALLTVTVTDQGDGTLDVQIEGMPEGGVFDNTFAEKKTAGNTDTDKGGSSAAVSHGRNPKTGDTSSVGFWMLLVLASGAALTVLRKKKTER